MTREEFLERLEVEQLQPVSEYRWPHELDRLYVVPSSDEEVKSRGTR